MTAPPASESALRRAWCNDFVGLPEWPVPAADIPQDESSILTALEAAPAGALE